MMLLTYQHGLRVRELTGLRLLDVDLTERSININRLKDSVSGRHPLFTGEARAIRDWLAVRETIEPDTDTLFVSEQRKPLSRATVDLLVKKIADAAGLSGLNVHAHMLTHSAGYSLINRGFDVCTVQVHLGHAGLRIPHGIPRLITHGLRTCSRRRAELPISKSSSRTSTS
jgi:type 1 fimbriae regulatory protein FimB